MCDKDLVVSFDKRKCNITEELVFKADRQGNVYTFDINDLSKQNFKCLSVVCNDIWMWHKRLGHANIPLILKLSKKELVRGLPPLEAPEENICIDCKHNKQTKASFHALNVVTTSKPLQLLHMDLFGPMSIQSLGGFHYVFVLIDDFSRFTWVTFLVHKSEAPKFFIDFYKRVEKEMESSIVKIRSDHGG